MAALLLAAPAAARAADVLTVPVSTSAAIPVADAGIDWSGFYAGVYGLGQSSDLGGQQLGLGVDIGANAQFEFVLVGAEVAVQGVFSGAGANTYAQGLGKLGLVITDGVVAYGAAGVGIDLGPANQSDVLLGGGVEFAVASDVTLGARYLHSFPITGSNAKDQITIGANFHF